MVLFFFTVQGQVFSRHTPRTHFFLSKEDRPSCLKMYTTASFPGENYISKLHKSTTAVKKARITQCDYLLLNSS